MLENKYPRRTRQLFCYFGFYWKKCGLVAFCGRCCVKIVQWRNKYSIAAAISIADARIEVAAISIAAAKGIAAAKSIVAAIRIAASISIAAAISKVAAISNV
jgi:hypothetical protein